MFFFLCKYPSGICPANWDHWGSKCCPTDFDLWENKCYHHSNDSLRTFPQTKTYCSSMGGKPITVLSEAEMTYVNLTYQPHFWLDCSDEFSEGLWTCGDYNAATLFYQDNSYIGYWSKYGVPLSYMSYKSNLSLVCSSW